MREQDKRKVLDALFDDERPGSARATAAEQRARKLLFDSDILPRTDELAARRIWQKHQMQMSPGRRRYWIPAVAAALFVLGIGWILVARMYEPGMARSLVKTTVQKHDFAEQYHRAVNLYVRQTENFRVSTENKTFQIAADTLTARIDFSANKAIKTVRIATPHVVFEIIGTKIVLDVAPDKARLYVNEGKVRVKYAGQTTVVEEGGVWVYANGNAAVSEETAAEETAFEELGKPLEKLPAISEPKKKATKYVRIALVDGTEISGRVVRETGESIVISSPLAGNKEILLERRNIRSIVKEGGER